MRLNIQEDYDDPEFPGQCHEEAAAICDKYDAALVGVIILKTDQYPALTIRAKSKKAYANLPEILRKLADGLENGREFVSNSQE